MKKRDIKALKAEWETYERVLEALRTLIQMVSLLSFALRAPSNTDEELRQLDNLARDAVRFFSQDCFFHAWPITAVLRRRPYTHAHGEQHERHEKTNNNV